MNEENKEQNQEMVKEWDETQVYHAEIVPKIMELVALLEKHKIPFLFNAVYAQDKEKSTATLIANNMGKASSHVAIMGIVSEMLNGDAKEAFSKLAGLCLLKSLMDNIKE